MRLCVFNYIHFHTDVALTINFFVGLTNLNREKNQKKIKDKIKQNENENEKRVHKQQQQSTN